MGNRVRHAAEDSAHAFHSPVPDDDEVGTHLVCDSDDRFGIVSSGRVVLRLNARFGNRVPQL